MLPSEYRLPASAYDQVKSQAELIKVSGLAVLKLKKDNQLHPRLGIIISTKISKKAVDRNLLKRRLRSILFSKLNQIPSNLDLVFLPSRQLLNISFEELKSKVNQLLQKI